MYITRICTDRNKLLLAWNYSLAKTVQSISDKILFMKEKVDIQEGLKKKVVFVICSKIKEEDNYI